MMFERSKIRNAMQSRLHAFQSSMRRDNATSNPAGCTFHYEESDSILQISMNVQS